MTSKSRKFKHLTGFLRQTSVSLNLDKIPRRIFRESEDGRFEIGSAASKSPIKWLTREAVAEGELCSRATADGLIETLSMSLIYRISARNLVNEFPESVKRFPESWSTSFPEAITILKTNRRDTCTVLPGQQFRILSEMH